MQTTQLSSLGLAVAAALGLIVGIAIFSRRRDDYSNVRNTISELGETGSADERRVGFGLFLPIGLAMAGISALTLIGGGDFGIALLAGCIAAGYLGAAFSPCDPGSPMVGSTKQSIHNLFGGVQYLGGAVALFRLSEQMGNVLLVAAIIVGVGLVAITPPSPVRGLIQRLAEAALFGGLIYALANSASGSTG